MILEAVFKEEEAVKADFGVGFPIGGKADYSIVANALKGTAIGSAVAMKDVSPLGHNIGVKLASKNIVDIKQMLNECLVDNGDGTFTYTRKASMVSASFPLKLKAGTEITSKAEIISSQNNTENSLCYRVTYADGAIKGYYLSDSKVTLEKDIVDILIYSYEANTSFVFKEWQLELGTTASPYAPFADVSSVTLKKYGKNFFVSDGYSATGDKGVISNGQGTMLSTTEASDTVIVNQTKYADASNPGSWANGYVCILFKEPLIENQLYAVSYDIEILDNPINTKALLMFFNGNYSFNEYKDTPYEVGKKYRVQSACTYHNHLGRQYFEIRNGGMSFVLSNVQIELGKTVSEYEPFKEPISYTPKADGTVEGVTSLYPTTTLLTDTEGVIISAEYNKDLNKAFAEIYQKLSALGVAVVNN